MMRSEIDGPRIPTGVAIIGSDDNTDAQYMLYFDEREVSSGKGEMMKDNERWEADLALTYSRAR